MKKQTIGAGTELISDFFSDVKTMLNEVNYGKT